MWQLQVPYQDLPFLFFGEEQAMLARMWTHSYDMYAPPRSIAWHQWSRSHRNTFTSCVPQVDLSLCPYRHPLRHIACLRYLAESLNAAIMLGLNLMKITAPDI